MLKSIFIKNQRTFYNYSNGEAISQAIPYAIKISLSILLSLLFFDISKEFTETLLTSYSILLGFGFNILFYLLSAASTKTLNNIDAEASIEKRLKKDKLKKLQDELFYNISYFNTIAITIVITLLIFSISDGKALHYIDDLTKQTLKTLEKEYNNQFYAITLIMKFIYFICIIALYALLIESLHTLLRMIGRISYYFEETIKG